MVRRAFMKFVAEYGYETVGAGTMREARALLARDPYVAMLLDRRRPDGDGLAICRYLREQGSEIAIIVLTALGEDIDVAEALKAGADDCVLKPPSVLVLNARIEAVLRRRQPGSPYRSRDMVIDPVHHKLTVRDPGSGQLVDFALTTRELRILSILADHPNEVVSRPVVAEAVWAGTPVQDNTIDVCMGRLRKRLGTRGEAIVTVRGDGYMLDVQRLIGLPAGATSDTTPTMS